MKKPMLFILSTLVITPMLFSTYAHAATNWEVRRLKNGTCGVAKIKPGVKPGSNRVAGPYPTKARASTQLKKLKSTPKCKRF